jgi:hypothetical protein
MLSKLRRLYRGLCWLMDVDCSMPWIRSAWTTNWVAMEDLEKLRRQVTALEGQSTRYSCNIYDTRAEHLSATITDTNTKEVYEGRLPLTNAGQPDPKPAPVICSPLTKMGLTAVTDAQFREMAVYVSDVLYSKQTFRAHYVGQSESEVIADALQAYAKGDR